MSESFYENDIIAEDFDKKNINGKL